MPDDEPTCLSYDSARAVDVVFQACKATGASLVTCHNLAAMVAGQLERIEARRAAVGRAPDA